MLAQNSLERVLESTSKAWGEGREEGGREKGNGGVGKEEREGRRGRQRGRGGEEKEEWEERGGRGRREGVERKKWLYSNKYVVILLT